MARLKWIYSFILISAILYLVFHSRNLSTIVNNIFNGSSHLQVQRHDARFKKIGASCPQLDGYNEWRQYHYWLNGKLNLPSHTGLTDTIKRLQHKQLSNEIAQHDQNLLNYKFNITYTEHEHRNINYIHIHISEYVKGKYLI